MDSQKTVVYSKRDSNVKLQSNPAFTISLVYVLHK